MKNHLKRIAAPKSWIINRKKNTFILRPNPGPHPLELGISLGIILRDLLKVGSTISEVKKILNTKEILVDGRRRKDPRFVIGLFDILAIPQLKKFFRLTLDEKGRLELLGISTEESKIKLCKIVGKTILSKGKTQLNLHDGKNIIVEKEVKVEGTLLLELPQLRIKSVFPLRPGAAVFLLGGRHSGSLGSLKEIKGKEATLVFAGREVETAKKYLFVVGDKEPAITIKPTASIKND